jgi:hypothetical protein
MPAWLASIIGGWLKDWAISAFVAIFGWFKKIAKYKRIEKENESKGAAVESAAEQVKKLLREGKEVPPELKEKLREESRRLVDGSFNPNNF